MRCPKCKAGSRVIDTHRRVDGKTWRRRFCANGHRFSTRQVKGEKEKITAEPREK